MPVNSLMSAPATKPLFFAEITTTPRGARRSSVATSPSSSVSTLPDSTFAEVPGLSRVSQAMPSASISSFQDGLALSFMVSAPGAATASGRRDGAYRSPGAHAEIAHQRAVIGEAHVRHAKITHLDPLGHQDEVQLDARHPRREGRQPGGIGAAQAGRAHEQVDLVRAPEGVEVARHDHRLGRLYDQIVQRAQLVLPVPELERQVHQEYAHIRQLEFDNQPLDAGVEVMEALAVHIGRRQEGVALLAYDRHEVID